MPSTSTPGVFPPSVHHWLDWTCSSWRGWRYVIYVSWMSTMIEIELYNTLCYRYDTWRGIRTDQNHSSKKLQLHLLCMCDLTFSLEKVRSSMISRYCHILVNHVNWNGKRHLWVNLLDLSLARASFSSGTSWRRFFLTGSATWPSTGSDEPATASHSASFAARVAALSRALWAEADTMPPKILRYPWVKGAKKRLQFEWSFLHSMYQWLGLPLECLGFAYGVQYAIHKSSINKASIISVPIYQWESKGSP